MLRRSFLASSAAAGLAVAATDLPPGKIKPGDIPTRLFGKTVNEDNHRPSWGTLSAVHVQRCESHHPARVRSGH